MAYTGSMKKHIRTNNPGTETERLAADLPKKLKREFDILTTQLSLTMSGVVEELVAEWVKQHRTKVNL